MHEFFKGWKRKVGLVTLVMAGAFTVSWVRSFYHMDVYGLQLPSMTFCVMSNADGILFDHRTRWRSRDSDSDHLAKKYLECG